MPKIRTYESQVSAPGPVNLPRENPDSYGAGIGRGVGDIGAAVGNIADVIAKRNEQAEVSDIKTKFASTTADFTDVVKEQLRTADPSDKNFVDNFMQTYDAHVAAIGDEVSTAAGRREFQQLEAEHRGHFLNYAVEGQAQLAGEKSKQDYTSSLSNWSSTLRSDPSSLPFVTQQHDSYLQDLVKNGHLSQEEAIKLKIPGDQDLAQNSIRGWIDLNPQLAKKQLNDGKWDQQINGDTKNQLLGQADQSIRAAEAEKERQRMAEKRALEEKQKVTQNGFLQKLVDGTLTDKDILKSNLDPFGSGSKETFIQLTKMRAENDKLRTDPSTELEITRRIHLPDGDPQKIVNEDQILPFYLDRKLSDETHQHLRDEVGGRKTEQGRIESEMKKTIFDQAEASLVRKNALTGLGDPEGEEQLLKFKTAFYQNYKAGRDAGKSNDQLLNPTSPDYLGKSINQFQKTQAQVMQGIARQMQGAVPATESATYLGTLPAGTSSPPSSPSPILPGSPAAPPKAAVKATPVKAPPARLPNESPAAFLKRTKGGG